MVLPLVAAGCGGAKDLHHAKPEARPHRQVTLVATARTRAVTVYRSRTSTRPLLRAANPKPSGAPLTFLVRERVSDRLEVYVDARPNGRRGWVDRRAVTLARDPYRVRIDLSSRSLVLLRGAHVISRTRVAVGARATPTPRGLFYVTELLRQPDPKGAYGPYAFGLSAYSNVLFSFGGGPGQIGIHGTNDTRSIGRAVSHGCIRLSNRAVRALARVLPLGTPVEIAA